MPDTYDNDLLQPIQRSTTCRQRDDREMPEAADIAFPCRCPFGGAADDVSRRWLAADLRAAQLSARFRAYYRVRSLLPLPIRQFLQRHRRLELSPRWYFPDEFTHALAEQIAAGEDGMTIIHPWPDDAEFAFVLTHDVETAEGMRRIAQIADLEEELGCRSSWNIVPYKYPVDRGLLRDLQDRGFEIGVHGYNHDGKLFTSRSVFDGRVPGIQAALQSFGAVGFRAPMVHRNLAWLQSLDIEYDASCFDIDPYQAMPGGVGGVWPFIAGRFVELPYTLPQDHTLFIALGECDGRIWREKLRYVARLRGMAMPITHPDYLDSPHRLAAYRQLLEEARQMPGMWHALPREVAAWWRLRDQSRQNHRAAEELRIEGPAAGRARLVTIRPCAPPAVNGRANGEMEGVCPTVLLEWNDAAPAISPPAAAASRRETECSEVS